MPEQRTSSCPILWLTGLSGAGKTTIGSALVKRLLLLGLTSVLVDGDELRQHLCQDLGFSAADRHENVRRGAAVAVLLARQGIIPVVAMISPYAEDRLTARRSAFPCRFIEVYIDTPLEVCRIRDPKRLYQRVSSGEITAFTGVSAPYEPPAEPELRIKTEEYAVDVAVERILTLVLG